MNIYIFIYIGPAIYINILIMYIKLYYISLSYFYYIFYINIYYILLL